MVLQIFLHESVRGPEVRHRVVVVVPEVRLGGGEAHIAAQLPGRNHVTARRPAKSQAHILVVVVVVYGLPVL